MVCAPCTTWIVRQDVAVVVDDEARAGAFHRHGIEKEIVLEGARDDVGHGGRGLLVDLHVHASSPVERLGRDPGTKCSAATDRGERASPTAAPPDTRPARISSPAPRNRMARSPPSVDSSWYSVAALHFRLRCFVSVTLREQLHLLARVFERARAVDHRPSANLRFSIDGHLRGDARGACSRAHAPRLQALELLLGQAPSPRSDGRAYF